ncbi:Lrp/AsnC ligand binding domain-containing protein [Vibrio lentus]|nr:Lrp/AsnC ligand binding domain-containing protein [Vibrio lentus]
MRDFEQHIEVIDEVLSAFLMTGNHDYLLHVVSESLKLRAVHPANNLTRLPNIASIESALRLDRVKTRTKLPVKVK